MPTTYIYYIEKNNYNPQQPLKKLWQVLVPTLTHGSNRSITQELALPSLNTIPNMKKNDLLTFIVLGDSSGLVMKITKMSQKLGARCAERSRQFGDAYRHRFAVIDDATYDNIIH